MSVTPGELQPHEYTRPMSIEDGTNQYFIHPLSDVIVKVSLALKLSPNFISLLGLFCGILAAYNYYNLPAPYSVLMGFGCMVMWHILDGADGRLARLTGNCSAFGRVLDGICDHLVFGAVYIVFALRLMETNSALWVWALVLGAAISHAIQSAGYEERRQKLQRRLKGVNRTDGSEGVLGKNGEKSFLASGYDKVQLLVSGKPTGLDQALSTLKGDENKRISVINKTVPMVKAWGLLNANNRTIFIAIVAYLGQPELFFMLEVAVLNVIMFILIFAERKQEQMLAKNIT